MFFGLGFDRVVGLGLRVGALGFVGLGVVRDVRVMAICGGMVSLCGCWYVKTIGGFVFAWLRVSIS